MNAKPALIVKTALSYRHDSAICLVNKPMLPVFVNRQLKVTHLDS